jgi:general stress protein 26
MATENLKNKAAIEKLKSLVDSIDICMMSSFNDTSSYPYTVPMSRQEIDEEGNIWYMLGKDSVTYTNLAHNSNVSLAFADVSAYKFLSIDGIATLSYDKERIDKYWNKFMEAYFETGKDDPNIRILKVSVDNAHYWDNKLNKLMTLFEIASSALTGKNMDIGREGDIDI